MSLDLTKKINRVVVDGTEMAVVGVPHLQDKEVTPTREIQTIRADEGYDGLNSTTVLPIPEDYIVPSGTLEITENETYDVKDYSEVVVNVASSGGGDDARLISLLEKSGTNVDIPEGTTKLGDYAFYNYKTLESITIPTTLTYLGNGCFNNCSALERVNVKDLNQLFTGIQLYAYNSTPFYSKADLYLNNTLVTEITIPSNITQGVLRGCTSIQTLNFESGITAIPREVAVELSNLRTVNIPSSVTTINTGAFSNCQNLQSITIPENVSTMGVRAFENCFKMTEFNFNARRCSDIDTTYPMAAYMGRDGGGVTVNIGSSVTRIPNHLFNTSSDSNRPNIIAVKFAPDTVCNSIGSSAFTNIKTIKTLVLSPSFTSIPFYFSSSTLDTLDCSAYTSIPTLGGSTYIKLSTTGKIYVPDELYDEWIVATNWSSFASQIVKASEMPTA